MENVNALTQSFCGFPQSGQNITMQPSWNENEREWGKYMRTDFLRQISYKTLQPSINKKNRRKGGK